MVFGELTVLKKADIMPNSKDAHTKWVCKCSCGNEVVVRSDSLRRGLTKSCGCLRKMIDDIKGERFGRLIVLEHVGFADNRVALWRCKCDCGNEIIVRQCNLRNGNTRSCGCLLKDISIKKHTTHGLTKTRLHNIWAKMKERCYNPHRPAYKNYGGKGVGVCDEWKDNFLEFYDWSISNGYNDDLTIDRVDSNGDYSPLNCRWVTLSENVRQKSKNSFITIGNLSLTIHEWAIRLNMSPATLMSRYREKGNAFIVAGIKKALKEKDNSCLYKRKEYAKKGNI